MKLKKSTEKFSGPRICFVFYRIEMMRTELAALRDALTFFQKIKSSVLNKILKNIVFLIFFHSNR